MTGNTDVRSQLSAWATARPRLCRCAVLPRRRRDGHRARSDACSPRPVSRPGREVRRRFDVDAKKVGFDLSEAIFASENNTIKIADVPPTNVTVQRGPTLDGIGKYYAETIEISDADPSTW